MTRIRIVMAMLVCALGVAPAVGQTTPQAVWQSTLTIGVASEGETFDPHLNVTSVGNQRIWSIYEGLLRYAPDGKIVGNLAESWKVSDDGRRYTFALRPGVKFSDGAPLNAQAVKFNFDRLLALKKGPVALFEPVTGVRAVDDATVEIMLREPFAPFVSVMAGSQAAFFLSPKAVKDHATSGDEWATRWLHTHTAGTGPYVLESWQPEDRVVLVSNPNYRGRWTDAHVRRVVYLLVREPSTAVQMLLRGDIDILEQLNVEFVPMLQRVPTVKAETAVTQGGRHGNHIFLNHRKPPLDNLKVRQAIAYAIDYDRILRDALRNLARQARGPIPHTFVPWFNPKATMYTKDIERARRLLRESGLQTGPTPIRLQLAYRAEWKEERSAGQIVKDSLTPLGFDVQLVEQTLPVWREAIWSGNTQMVFFTSTGRYIDPDASLYLYYHSSNIRRGAFNTGYKNEHVDRLLETARRETNRQNRIRLYHEVQEIITRDVGALFMVDLLNPYAIRTYVAGFTWNSNYGAYFDAYTMRKDPAGFRR